MDHDRDIIDQRLLSSTPVSPSRVPMNMKVETVTIMDNSDTMQPTTIIDPDSVTLLVRTDAENNIYTITLDGNNKKYLTIDGNSENGYSVPSWSPDGSKIVYTNGKVGDPSPSGGLLVPIGHIWTMNADGSGPKQLTFGPLYGA